MKTMLCVLAIASVMATICSGDDDDDNDGSSKKFAFVEFVENYLKEDTKLPAELINTDLASGSKYKKAATSNMNVVNLILISKPTLSDEQKRRPHSSCGYDLGINFPDDKEVFCELHTITLKVFTDERGDQQLQLVLQFQSKSARELKLYVPIFEMPVSSAECQVEHVKWTRNNNLGAFGRLKPEDFDTLRGNYAIPLSFRWLQKLVSHGLYNRESIDGYKFSAYTRPVLSQRTVIEGLIQFWNEFKGSGDEASSSNAV